MNEANAFKNVVPQKNYFLVFEGRVRSYLGQL